MDTVGSQGANKDFRKSYDQRCQIADVRSVWPTMKLLKNIGTYC